MNIPGTKIWFSKRDQGKLNDIIYLYQKDSTGRDLMISYLATDMVKRAKQGADQILTVYDFLRGR